MQSVFPMLLFQGAGIFFLIWFVILFRWVSWIVSPADTLAIFLLCRPILLAPVNPPRLPRTMLCDVVETTTLCKVALRVLPFPGCC